MTALTHAMVLAAGLGTRMRYLTRNRPKPLVPVAGQTLIDRTLDRVSEAGIPNAVVNLHYLPSMLRTHLIGRQAPAITFSDETSALLETGGGIVKALPLLGSAPFLTVNSDNIWIGERPFAALTEMWDAARMDALLLLVAREDAVGYTRAGDFSLDSDGRLVRRGEAAEAPLVFTGAQILAPRLFENAPKGAFSLNMQWDQAIAAGRAFGVVHRNGWCDVGTPEGLQLAEKALDHVR